MSDFEFQVVDKAILDKLETRGSNRHTSKYEPVYKQLMEGETISVTNVDKKKLQSFYQSARDRGFVMKLRSGILDTVPTLVFWWEKKKEN